MTQIYPDSILRWSKVKTRKKGPAFFRLTNGSPETDHFEKSEKSHFFARFLGEPSVSNFLQTSKRSPQRTVAGLRATVCHFESGVTGRKTFPPKTINRDRYLAPQTLTSKDHQAVSSCCCFGWWVFGDFIYKKNEGFTEAGPGGLLSKTWILFQTKKHLALRVYDILYICIYIII